MIDNQTIDRAIQDTLALTESVRDYLTAQNGPESPGEGAPPVPKLESTRISGRLINLLANSMAWLMWCKALSVEEIEASVFMEKNKEFQELAPLEIETGELPEEMAALIRDANALLKRNLLISASFVDLH